MNDETTRSVVELSTYRRARGLTQGDLARLLGVTQQAVAKWENSGAVPEHRLKLLAKHLHVPVEALLPPNEGTVEEQDHRTQVWLDEFMADQVVVCFPEISFHYCPTSVELRAAWRSLGGGGFAHLSAGPVQVLINVRAATRIDISEDPPLTSYRPYPINPVDEERHDDNEDALLEDDQEDIHGQSSDNQETSEPPTDPQEESGLHWFQRGEARVYIRGASQPYSAPQSFFDDVLDKPELSKQELIELHDAFERERPDAYSIFDLFHRIASTADMDPSVYGFGEELHADALHLFQSEDYDGVPQRTLVHTRDLLVVEVPTRIWKLYELGLAASLEAVEANTQAPTRASRKKGTKGKR
jgi:transcriptional regulator with XRE-family HTH domain